MAAESNSTSGRIDIAANAELTDKTTLTTECRLTSAIVAENFNQASSSAPQKKKERESSGLRRSVKIKRSVPNNGEDRPIDHHAPSSTDLPPTRSEHRLSNRLDPVKETGVSPRAPRITGS